MRGDSVGGAQGDAGRADVLGCYGAHVREVPAPGADRACGQAGDVSSTAGEYAYTS